MADEIYLFLINWTIRFWVLLALAPVLLLIYYLIYKGRI